MIDWPQAVELLAPMIVKIMTPRGSGTGFIIASSEANNICGIATAAHVVNAAHFWEEPLRIEHVLTGHTQMLRHTDRAIIIDEPLDTAAILIPRNGPLTIEDSLPLIPESKYLKVGHEVGWLGFPAVSPNNLCFFMGRTSCFVEVNSAYLIDGVVINGVSGGPAFHRAEHFP